MEISCDLREEDQLRVWWGTAVGNGYDGWEA